MIDSQLMVQKADQIVSGSVCFEAPSNIALVKYWGKHGTQLPKNPNASFTLSKAKTITRLSWAKKDDNDYSKIQLQLYFDEKLNVPFGERITKFFDSLLEIYPFLEQFSWRIDTRNTFPHGAGIASSASAMAAVAACLVALEEQWFSKLPPATKLQKMSYIARLGSGSASRSIFPIAAAWGQSTELQGSDDTFAIGLKDSIHSSFTTYRDSILLVSSEEKSVSSSAGHGLMENQAYAPTRYDIANRRFKSLLSILRQGNLEDFCTLVEADALDLHALMMQSSPPYILMEPNTIAVIKAIQRFRKENNIPVCFTLDAGPNVHLLYPDAFTNPVQEWINDELLRFCPQGKIDDHTGSGVNTATWAAKQ